VLVTGAHVAAALKERAADTELGGTDWVDVCGVDEIPENRARVRTVGGERVAIFRYDGKVSAISNVCRHQAGPLGEGKIIDGCVTCPWHGFQYLPETGASPPPFSEKVETFDVRVVDGRVLVRTVPNDPGTFVEAARF
jgi:nitrite reductase/ring-hydroxylating ferredoxin subunit